MKLLSLFIIMSMSLFSCSDNSVPAISVTELKKQSDENQSFILLDVRTMPEFLAGRLSFSDDLIPYDSLPHLENQLPVNKDTTIYCFCRSGRRSGIATEYLRSIGYTKVYNVTGGIIAWQDNGFQIISGPWKKPSQE